MAVAIAETDAGTEMAAEGDRRRAAFRRSLVVEAIRLLEMVRASIVLLCLVACGARSALDDRASTGGGGGGTSWGGDDGGGDSALLPTRVLLFGGAKDKLPEFGYLADAWTWGASGWAEAPASPPARIVSAMAYLDGRVVMFGGKDSQGHYLDDTWEWDGSWHQRLVTSPSARGRHAMVSFGNVIALEGGYGNQGALHDTWEWDGVTWKKIDANGPDLAGGAMAAIDDRIVALVGPMPNGSSNQTWIFNGTKWAPLDIDVPSERTEYAMASEGTSALLFGGYRQWDGVLLDDTWEFDGNTWIKRSVAGPSARCAYAMTSVGDSVILFGGLTKLIADDTWQWRHGEWTPLGNGPGARYASAMSAAF